MQPLIFESFSFEGDGADLFDCVRHHSSPILLENTATSDGVAFVGVDPWATFTWSSGEGVIERRDGNHGSFTDPMAALREGLAVRGADSWDQSIVAGFCGGLAGYFGYGIRTAIESTPDQLPDVVGLPDMRFGLYDLTLTLVGDSVHVVVWPGADERFLQKQVDELRAVLKGFRRSSGDTVCDVPGQLSAVLTDCTRQEYVDQVEEIRELIREGSVYQVNLTQRFRIPCDEDPLIVYRRMRLKHPAPYSAFIPIGESAILSSSPECFLRSDGMHVESRPIKGTIRRSRDADQDADLQGQLRDSEKDLAELTMIVDLVRNDLSRVCRGGSIRVEEHAHIESAPTVHHLVTSVKGELEVGRDGFDLLRAALPAGSITGAPKVRAMELIDNLERVRRGVYTGSIGFIAPDASMDLSVAIRTVVLSNRVAHVFGGGGIVIDSLPESEYDESLVKVRGLIDLLGGGFTS